jgi:pimeloyl-ACP methyl ester carboxylesterase
MSAEITLRDIQANGFTFRCREAGPRNGELVVLLHGFPETSHMWVRLMPLLADAGFRVLAPDQRGYSPGARPEGKENYRYADIAGDVLALADAVGSTRFHLVGHDWGALAGWAVVCTWPQRVASWTALSVPHARAFGSAIREDSDQRQRSQYVNLFVTEGEAEDRLLADDAAILRSIWSSSDAEELAEYTQILTQREALTGGLNWYRGSDGIAPHGEGVSFGDVTVPTLTIWGNQDNAIGRKSNDDAAQYMKGRYKWVELDAGHWLIQEKFDEVSGEILAHLRANLMRPSPA